MALMVVGLLALLGACGQSYLSLSGSPPRVTAITPKVTDDISSVFQAGADFASGNLLGAAGRIIEDVDFQLAIDVQNSGSVPVYLGTSDHVLVLNGVPVTDPVSLKGGWISAGATSRIPMSATLLWDQLPGAVVLGIVQGGVINLQVRSTVGWGFLSRTIETPVTRFTIIESVESVVRGLLPN